MLGFICASLICSVDLLLGGFLCKELTFNVNCKSALQVSFFMMFKKSMILTSCGSVVMRFRGMFTLLDLDNYNPVDMSIHGHSLCSKTQSTESVFIYQIIIQSQLGNNDA